MRGLKKGRCLGKSLDLKGGCEELVGRNFSC